MLKELVDFLNSEVSGCSAELKSAQVGDDTIFVSPESILKVCEALKAYKAHPFNVLQVITGTDYPDRIELSYILAAYPAGHDLIIKTKLAKPKSDSVPEIESVVSVWRSADFQEREAYDMVGVNFLNHPDLRRILCPYDWEGFPLRKDYVVQEKYHNLTVNPEEKINNPDFEFYKNLQAKLGPDQKITHSWDGSKSLTLNSDLSSKAQGDEA